MDKDLHVVLVPYAAFGHLFPFFHLSIALAEAGIRVSFISTPRNIQRLPKPPSELSAFINLVAFPLPVIDGSSLPEGAEATVDVSLEKEVDLRAAYDLLCHPFKKFIANESPNWIGVDVFPHWVIDIAANFRVPVFCFSVVSAATMVFRGPPECLTGEGLKKVRPSPESLTSPPEWVTFPSSVAFRRGAEANGSYYLYYNGHLGERVSKVLNGCKAVAVHTCKEIEGDYLEVLEKIYQKPVIPVGFFPLDQPEQRDYHDEEWLKIFNWLDQQKPKSVVFVGFGSTCKLSKDQVHEIAFGLELSNLPFLWSLIKSEEASEIVDDVDVLPPSFIKNTAGRGLVCIGWAPQVEILANPAIGGSMFHAGWGSVIENLRYGHRLIVLPLVFDQILNARLLVDKGLAVQVEQNEDGSFSRDAIAKCLRQAMASEEGNQIGLKAAEVAAAVNHPTLHQEHYISEFVQYLKNGVRAQN
ncbi:soyasaponin III rhamnosyltransferase-like [Macadamia integrifolia]|uniref:soyasaponin III rhamnosyltransferase-like n=1 Tax=Macadamia integrifolia TaxID=60698 RepID=UPI001C4EDEBF|nr:soyasaponin III rhamnosyltransferase-like [Macadamia integrifolia]XP_042492922.1 soyasaponin III rhamnosyltransferase-like [Macadamia integrifolia]XP_042492923.1 soyasaponin III rhamnosyltransferase-like [Macadamia integrifolia]XP_042492924.1 soyasaponin III rhamnosyltransferase-like [Macadamia integrifolia]XP_042492925.1 soyasaponin III rhamnosyltransferase-like [Macadamia integrifolia]XP_042492926.1 soyasaponin III rhamnosyltransferase-like [Macadamia integrifolia]XP_042492927.1 soyasapo